MDGLDRDESECPVSLVLWAALKEGFASAEEIRLWCDRMILKAPSPPDWIIEANLSRDAEALAAALSSGAPPGWRMEPAERRKALEKLEAGFIALLRRKGAIGAMACASRLYELYVFLGGLSKEYALGTPGDPVWLDVMWGCETEEPLEEGGLAEALERRFGLWADEAAMIWAKAMSLPEALAPPS